MHDPHDDRADLVSEDAKDLVTIVKRIDQRLRQATEGVKRIDRRLQEASKPPMIDPDCYDEPTEGTTNDPGPEEPPLEVAKRLLHEAENMAANPQIAAEYREQAEVWLAIHQEGRW